MMHADAEVRLDLGRVEADLEHEAVRDCRDDRQRDQRAQQEDRDQVHESERDSGLEYQDTHFRHVNELRDRHRDDDESR